MATRPQEAIPMPKTVNSLPDVPEDGIWDITRRIAGIIMKRFKAARNDPKRKITKKELMKEQYNDMISTSDNNIIKSATPKQRDDAFGMFLDNLLEDSRTHEMFTNCMELLSEADPDAYTKRLLEIQKLRHPVDKSMNVDINLQVKKDMHARISEQYRYSQLTDVEEAEIVEDTQQDTPRLERIANMARYANPEESGSIASTFEEQNENYQQ